jgi:hypothetical protein
VRGREEYRLRVVRRERSENGDDEPQCHHSDSANDGAALHPAWFALQFSHRHLS